MSNKKADIGIGRRAVEELYRKFPMLTDAKISKVIGINRKSLWFWKQGETPSGFALQKICYAGCDVKYILTGIRSIKRS